MYLGCAISSHKQDFGSDMQNRLYSTDYIWLMIFNIFQCQLVEKHEKKKKKQQKPDLKKQFLLLSRYNSCFLSELKWRK